MHGNLPTFSSWCSLPEVQKNQGRRYTGSPSRTPTGSSLFCSSLLLISHAYIILTVIEVLPGLWYLWKHDQEQDVWNMSQKRYVRIFPVPFQPEILVLDMEEHGEEDADAAAGKQRRYDQLQRSIGGPKPLQNVSNHQLGLATPLPELETLKSASQKGNWTIFVTPRRSKTVDTSMGNATFVMSGATPMQSETFLHTYTFQVLWHRLWNTSICNGFAWMVTPWISNR
jgi:hypothetical protein